MFGKFILFIFFIIPGFLISTLPRKVQLMFGKLIGNLMYYIFKFRLDIVRNNLHFTLKNNFSEKELKQIEKKNYEHMGTMVVEIFHLFYNFPEFVKKYSKVYGIENYIEAHKKGKGVIVLSSHLGNWEIMAAAGASSGIKGLIITKKLKPQALMDYIASVRMKFNIKAAYEPRTFDQMLAQLQKGECVACVLDQYAGAPYGVKVPFVNRWVGTHGFIAVLVEKTGAEVVPVYNVRDENGVYSSYFGKALPYIQAETREERVYKNTLIYTKTLEEHILKKPEQWLWIHKRWKGDMTPPIFDDINSERNKV